MEAIIGVQNRNKGTPGLQRDYSCRKCWFFELFDILFCSSMQTHSLVHSFSAKLILLTKQTLINRKRKHIILSNRQSNETLL